MDIPDGETKNEIDHLLVDDLAIVKNVNVLSRFKFPSDHRIVRGTILIPKRVKVKNILKNETIQRKVIPPGNFKATRYYLNQ